jgi:hypothetical protein
MLKFSVQTFYQPLFSTFPSAILFPSVPFQKFPHQKAQRKSFFPIFKGKKPPGQKAKSQAKKSKSPKVQKPKVKPPKAKSPLPPSGVFYSSKQGGAMGRGVTSQQEKPVFLLL